jgi:deazaflavin-dependent oxidoreductase (nitroreductase family)
MSTTTSPAPSATAPAEAPLPLAIRALRRTNPLVLQLLASPLHGLASRDILALEVRGRKTGRLYRLPLSYVRSGDDLYCCTRPEVAGWWKNLAPERPVEIVLRGKRLRARAEVLDNTSPEAARGFRAFMVRNPKTASSLYNVGRVRRGEPNAEDLARELPLSRVVRLQVVE